VSEELLASLAANEHRQITEAERQEQRLSFACGNGMEEGDIVSIDSLKRTDRELRALESFKRDAD
jgi:hypothetical protein